MLPQLEPRSWSLSSVSCSATLGAKPQRRSVEKNTLSTARLEVAHNFPLMSPRPLLTARVHCTILVHPRIPQPQSHCYSCNVETTSCTNKVSCWIPVFLLSSLPNPLCDDLPYPCATVVESNSEWNGEQTGRVASHPVRQARRARKCATGG